MKRWFLHLIPLGLLLASVVFRLLEPSFVEEIRLKVFDFYQRGKPRIYQDTPVRIIDIDEESLKRLGQWPWPRTRLAELVDRLSELEVSAIAFDMIFPEPDRTSPKNILPLWASTPAVENLRSRIGELEDHDQVMADALKKAKTVTGIALLNEENDVKPPVKVGYTFVGKEPFEYLPPFHGAVASLAVIENASAANGCINTIQERDGVIRRVPLLFRLNDVFYPSLAAGALSVRQNEPNYLLRYSGDDGESKFAENQGIVSVNIGDFSVPTDEQGRMWLYDTGFVPSRFIPAWKVLSEGYKTLDLKDKIVFLGTSAAGLKDLRITPLNPIAAGVEVQAQLLEQIFSHQFLERPDWALGAEIMYLIVFSFILIGFTRFAGAAWSAVLGIFFSLGAWILSWFAFTQKHWLIDALFPSVTLLLLYLTVSLIHYLRTEAEKRHVRTAFSRYLAPALVEKLVKHPELLKLGGETKNITILFSDIRGFTTLSEQFNAHELTSFMNQFLTPMTELLLNQSATIDKYIGDCIMAFWNAPLDDPAHAAHACQAACNMRQYLVHWNQEWKVECESKGRPPIPVNIGIGINTGECCVGNMGSVQHFNYSVLGDEVNLASRLEGQSKAYGVDIVLGM
ncbi:MAG TPA: adenylate/guanylate cyclase domain-containing protein, partial [bacterium]|nr:adenylate/guanylate cyclase domain-containing protein [bacterium]